MARLLLGSCVVAIAIAAACGSRSGLLVGGGGAGAGGSGQDASAGASGTGGSGGSGATGGSSGGGGTGGTPFVCAALSAGVATEVLSFPDRHAVAPSAVLLDAFSPSRVALQVFATGGSSQLHDDIRLARYLVDDAAPAGISLELEPILAGIESHGWSTLALAPGGLREVALAWHGDPGGFGRPMFRTVDFDSWSPGATVDLTTGGDGEAVLDLAPGASTGAFGAGYAGDGYGVVWRDVMGPSNDFTRPVAAVLDAAGGVRIGPHEVSPPSGYPGRSPSILWTGTTYLLATAVGTCTAGTGPCVDQSIVVSRLRPASGDAVDDSGVELVHAIGVTPGFVAGRPALARDGTLIRLAWIERSESAGSMPARVLLTTLAHDGAPAGFDAVLTPGSEPESRVNSHAADGATALIWAEDGDPSLADSAIGRSRIVVQRIDASGLSTLVAEIPSPLVHDYGSPSLISRGSPGALLAVWSARSMIDGHDVTYAARLDCTEPSSASYDAFWGPPTALERVHVLKRDPVRDICFHMVLVFPDGAGQYAVSMPEQWGVEALVVRQGQTSCGGAPFEPGAVSASAASGAIDWPGSTSGASPCLLDLAVSATFPASAPWVPATEALSTQALKVFSGPCG